MAADPESLEISIPENLIADNYIATFIIENFSGSSEKLNDREYSVEEIHSEDDGISKITVIDPHRTVRHFVTWLSAHLAF